MVLTTMSLSTHAWQKTESASAASFVVKRWKNSKASADQSDERSDSVIHVKWRINESSGAEWSRAGIAAGKHRRDMISELGRTARPARPSVRRRRPSQCPSVCVARPSTACHCAAARSRARPAPSRPSPAPYRTGSSPQVSVLGNAGACTVDMPY